MIKRILLLGLVGVLSLPLIHFVLDKSRPEAVVDFTSREWKAREALIPRARVFPASPPRDPHPLDPLQPVECEYVPKSTKATTPKFDCRLSDGQVIKVKYGWTPEK